MISRYFLAFFLISLGPLATEGQVLNHGLRASADDVLQRPRQVLQSPDTVNLLAVMVQFQVDSDERTTGNGLFDTAGVTSGNIRVDAPPRAFEYFNDHLTFLSNYYRKVSKGKTVIRPTLIPSVVSLPHVMGFYSPAKNGSNQPVVYLARDAWHAVDSARLVQDFSAYQCFVVFHAGVGRDIDLVGVLGYDPTPLDIPSLYMGSTVFSDFIGTKGIPVRNGTFLVPNTVLIPETESRTIAGAGGDVLLEYSINGLLCASVGNFLGLPDLFDTKTGATAIGRFGLMDGQSIFSFNGVFPPEPSAWEKYWLGWISPIDVGQGTTAVTLPAVGLADTVYRVGINANEYYLVENRNRDPLRNGQKITARYRGTTTTYIFARDTVGFNAFDIDALAGVVTDVEDFDWSLPGGVDENGTFYDGGTLIWHIDERVIANGVGSNAINADPNMRGVDLEEADGSQDLGEQYGFLSAGGGSENGTALDFWFKGNASPVNKNEFSATSQPNTNSSGGAKSHIVIRNFSERGPRMTATVSVGDQMITPFPLFPRITRQLLTNNALTVSSPRQGGEQVLVVAGGNESVPPPRLRDAGPSQVTSKLFAWSASGGPAFGTLLSPREDIAALPSGTRQFRAGVAIRDITQDGVDEIVSVSDEPSLTVRAFSLRDANNDGLADTLFSVSLTGSATCSPLIADSVIVIGGSRGYVHVLDWQGRLLASGRVLSDTAAEVLGITQASLGNQVIVGGSDGTLSLVTVPKQAAPLAVTASVRLAGRLAGPASSAALGTNGGANFVAALTVDGILYLFDSGLSPLPGFPRSLGDTCLHPPALADLDGDGRRDIIAFAGRTIWALNASGAVLDHYPITVGSLYPLTSDPIIGDIDGDGTLDIVAVSSDGLVYAYSRSGELVKGFPVSAGTGTQSAAVFFRGDTVCLAVASSKEGSLHAWITGRRSGGSQAAGNSWWQFQQNAARTGSDFSRLAGQAISSDFFPVSRAYNWPNPVFEGKTYIRYFVREASDVRIRIVDLAGDRVTEFAGPGVGGVDNEIVWDVSGVQSGVYFAHIEATGTAGSGKAVVKIAVVK